MPLNVDHMQAIPRPDLPSIPRVVIVDADRRVLQSLSDLLGVSGEVDVVGRAADVRSALEEIERVHPDVVLVDPRLPDVDAGMALIGGMARAWPSLRVVVTGWSDAEGRPVLNGKTCFVQKGSSPEEFVDAIIAGCRD
jgi:DNA-binding NarL/FixJ family response regulator